MADAAAQFLKDAEGRYPLSNNMGAAETWVGKGAVPRPDKTMGWLLGLSIVGGLLGVDHFYLRSPLTGLAKGLTFGGLGLWWIWDILQISTESDRVVKYGLTTPFDFTQGIGQGMITDKETHYAQRSRFSLWQLAAIFGFVGMDSFLLGKWGQGARKVVEFVILIAGVVSLAIAWSESGVSGLLTFGKIITILIVMFFGGMVFTNWGLSLSTIFMNPEKLFTSGIKLSAKTDNALNSYKSFLKLLSFILDEKDIAQVEKDMNYGSVEGAEFKKRFSIEREEKLEAEANAEAADSDDTDTKWLKSFFIWLGMIPLFGFQMIVSICKWIYYAIFPLGALASETTKIAIKKAEMTTELMEKQLEAAAEQGLDALNQVQLPSIGFGNKEQRAPADQQSENTDSQPYVQGGGARRDSSELSTEAKVLGAAVIAIIGGGALKAAVDSLVAE